MSRFKFEITANKFELKVIYNEIEEYGIEKCKAYMTKFQNKVANVQMAVTVSAKDKEIQYHHGEPYIYQKTLIRKPLTHKEKKVRYVPVE